MEKTLDPYNNDVHLLDKSKKDKLGLFHLCACGKSSGLLWEKIHPNIPLTCLVCMMKENKRRKET